MKNTAAQKNSTRKAGRRLCPLNQATTVIPPTYAGKGRRLNTASTTAATAVSKAEMVNA